MGVYVGGDIKKRYGEAMFRHGFITFSCPQECFLLCKAKADVSFPCSWTVAVSFTTWCVESFATSQMKQWRRIFIKWDEINFRKNGGLKLQKQKPEPTIY